MNHCKPCDYERSRSCQCLEDMPVAMAYLPWQEFNDSFDLCKGFQVGTIFPELCLPFCGKRGGCRE